MNKLLLVRFLMSLLCSKAGEVRVITLQRSPAATYGFLAARCWLSEPMISTTLEMMHSLVMCELAMALLRLR